MSYVVIAFLLAALGGLDGPWPFVAVFGDGVPDLFGALTNAREFALDTLSGSTALESGASSYDLHHATKLVQSQGVLPG